MLLARCNTAIQLYGLDEQRIFRGFGQLDGRVIDNDDVVRRAVNESTDFIATTTVINDGLAGNEAMFVAEMKSRPLRPLRRPA
jgi:hypothetical protein